MSSILPIAALAILGIGIFIFTFKDLLKTFKIHNKKRRSITNVEDTKRQ